RITESFDFLGIPYWVSKREDGSGTNRHIRISAPGEAGWRGGEGTKRQHLVNFLNWAPITRHPRKVKQWDSLLLTSNFGHQDRVIAIEEEGPGEVVSMQTETGNYVVWGFASKNCRLLYITHPIVASA